MTGDLHEGGQRLGWYRVEWGLTGPEYVGMNRWAGSYKTAESAQAKVRELVNAGYRARVLCTIVVEEFDPS